MQSVLGCVTRVFRLGQWQYVFSSTSMAMSPIFRNRAPLTCREQSRRVRPGNEKGKDMHVIKKNLIKDLLDGNVVIGPDGGLWYPSGPEETYTLESLLVELIAPRNALNKKALLAVVNAANINLEE